MTKRVQGMNCKLQRIRNKGSEATLSLQTINMGNRRNLASYLSLLVFCLLLFTGCAPKKLPELVWPLPPDPPKIRFDRSFINGKQFYGGGTSIADVILGEEVVAGFSKPNGVHTDREGKIYITDTGFGTVMILDPKAKGPTILETAGRSPFAKPIGVTTDPAGNIYVSDTTSDKIFVFDKDRNFVKAFGMGGEFKQPAGIAVDPTGKKLYVVDTHKHQIYVLSTEDGAVIMTIGKRGKEEGELNFPAHLAVDQKGNIYVVDTMNGRVQVFNPEGKFLQAFGKLGDGAGMFARPKGIAIDSEGHIYVVDAAFNNVQVFNSEGQILLAFGGFGEGRGQQILPAGLAIDNEDRIYVIDQWNARVNIYEYMGEKYKARKGIK